MTDRVSPSPGSVALGYQAATAIRYAGQTDGWVVPTAESPILADTYADITTPVGEFTVVTEGTTTVTIDSGEAFVGGANLVRDEETEVAVPSAGGTHTLYLGWAASGNNTVIIGTEDAFADKDPRIPLVDVDVASSEVTGTTFLAPNEPVMQMAADAQKLGGKPADSYAVRTENETISGRWKHTSDLELDGNDLVDTGTIHGANTDARIDFSNGNPGIQTDGDGSSHVGIWDRSASNFIARFIEGGTVEIPNGPIDMDGNEIDGVASLNSPDSVAELSLTGNPTMFTPGGGSGRFNIYDRGNGATLAKFNEGGLIEFTNRSFTVSGDDVVTGDDEYKIVKNGSDGNGIINFKTS